MEMIDGLDDLAAVITTNGEHFCFRPSFMNMSMISNLSVGDGLRVCILYNVKTCHERIVETVVK